MFERFTDRARQCVVFAQEEARLLNHDYIGTEHILLSLARDDGQGGSALKANNITYDQVLAQVMVVVGRPEEAPTPGHLPFTRHAKKILEDALREALVFGHNYIGTEHLLLGLLRGVKQQLDDNPVVQILENISADPKALRRTVISQLPAALGRTIALPDYEVTNGALKIDLEDHELSDLDALIAEHGYESPVVRHAIAHLLTRRALALYRELKSS